MWVAWSISDAVRCQGRANRRQALEPGITVARSNCSFDLPDFPLYERGSHRGSRLSSEASSEANVRSEAQLTRWAVHRALIRPASSIVQARDVFRIRSALASAREDHDQAQPHFSLLDRRRLLRHLRLSHSKRDGPTGGQDRRNRQRESRRRPRLWVRCTVSGRPRLRRRFWGSSNVPCARP